MPADTKLTPRPKEIPAWDSLSADRRKLYARMMEVYAAALAHCDDQIGRVVDAVKDEGLLDNTLIIYIQGDNGPSPEGSPQGTMNEIGVTANGVPETLQEMLAHIDDLGGPLAFNNYPVGWCHAMATPFQWMKRIASHFGGTRNGMVISWPKRIKDHGGIRSQFHHLIDVAPTILEAARIVEPVSVNGVKQKPIEGVSMVYSFDDAKARSRHRTQYFEIAANRGIYRDGWVACTTPLQIPWVHSPNVKNPADDFQWELYNIDEDFSEANNLAKKYPKKLHELQDLWWVEAGRHNVLPLDADLGERWKASYRPSLARDRRDFTYHVGTVRMPEGSAPDLKNRSYRITAEVEIPSGGAEGVLATQGGRFGGWGLMLLDGKPEFVYAFSNRPRHKYRIASSKKLSAGKHMIHVRLHLRRRRHRQRGDGDALRRRSEGGQRPRCAYDGHPPVAQRDIRHRRGHRHSGHRGLRHAHAIQIHRQARQGDDPPRSAKAHRGPAARVAQRKSRRLPPRNEGGQSSCPSQPCRRRRPSWKVRRERRLSSMGGRICISAAPATWGSPRGPK